MQRFLNPWLCFVAVVLASTADAGPNAPNANLSSLTELQRAVAGQGNSVQSFRVGGVVCAILSERKTIALQDDSATVLLQLPELDSAIRVGDRLTIEGNQCTVLRTRFGIQLGTEAVNNDGAHSALLKTTRIFLDAGRQPIRLEWFNQAEPAALNLQYEGPGFSRQQIPADTLWWLPVRETNFQHGLHFAAYVQKDVKVEQGVPLAILPPNGWEALPDFTVLKPQSEGTATNFDIRYRLRNEYAALVFRGYLQIPKSGIYTFYLESDDGSRLYIGEPSARCKIMSLHDRIAPVKRPWQQAVSAPAFQWSELTGTADFVGRSGDEMEIALSTGSGLVRLVVIGAPSESSTSIVHQQITAAGVCEISPDGDALMVVPGWTQIKSSGSGSVTAASATNGLLTTVGAVRRLKPQQAETGIPTRIKGVVIAATSDSLVLEDSSGGVFIHWKSDNPANYPHVGELWEIEGKTDPGDFSPVVFATSAKFLGNVPMPEPILPTWDQLMNGSLDAEYVELRGAVTAISANEIVLLTPDGKVSVEGNPQRPLPLLSNSILGNGSPIGSVVRMRGCFTADWNWETRQVNGGRFNLYPGMVEIEEEPLRDPFSLPAIKAADLLRFNARASALQPTKVAGQIIHARPGEYFVLDDQTGVRVFAATPQQLRTGDLIEAVGFPKLGGPSPVLQDAQIKATGRAPLPEPVLVGETNLLDRALDSTLVQIKATLISDTVHQDERVLELQNGEHRFAGVLRTDPRTWIMYSPGSELEVTGVYSSEERGTVGTALYPFEILLNNAGGILLLKQPPWWTVRRAIAVAAALAGALGIAFVWITLLHRKVEQRTAQLQKEIEARQVVEQHRAVDQERTRVARDLHDELGAGLTELGILGELSNNPAIPEEEKSQYLRQLAELTRTLVTGLDEIVWATNPHYDSSGSMATYFSFFADRFLKVAGIACRLRVAEGIPEHPVNSQIRHGVFLAFKEALNNVIRHAGATEVELRIQADGDELAISIRDNGCGVTPTSAAPGSDGLAGMRERLRQFGGSCSITSSPGKGTAVEFRLPLRPAAATNVKDSKIS